MHNQIINESSTSEKNIRNQQHRSTLKNIAHRAMVERELLAEFSPEAIKQLAQIESTPIQIENSSIDLRNLPWCSIDNNDTKDIDQLTVVHSKTSDNVKVLVAIADVDALVKKGSPIDEHAKANTTSVYTAAEMFPMLPLKLSTDMTSLNPDQDRRAIVIEMDIDNEGVVNNSKIYLALVRNHSKLAYNSVAAWLEGKSPIPESISKIENLSENIRMQDKVAQHLRKRRHEHGALNFESIQTKPLFFEDIIQDLEIDAKNNAKELIEDFMIAANSVTARFLKNKGIPSLRRIVHQPKRWERIVEVADKHNYKLPMTPSAEALSLFLNKQKSTDPLLYQDLSLTIIKLIGKGEYVVEFPDEKEVGHFGLAIIDYTHSTAPNRRFPDLITQRMLKASLKGEKQPYQNDELIQLAQHCTDKEDAVNKVERQVIKSAAALLLVSQIGNIFNALCTGASDKGTWVRIFHPPIEGRLINECAGVDVGHRLKVKLIHVDVEKGHIDFNCI